MKNYSTISLKSVVKTIKIIGICFLLLCVLATCGACREHMDTDIITRDLVKHNIIVKRVERLSRLFDNLGPFEEEYHYKTSDYFKVYTDNDMIYYYKMSLFDDRCLHENGEPAWY